VIEREDLGQANLDDQKRPFAAAPARSASDFPSDSLHSWKNPLIDFVVGYKSVLIQNFAQQHARGLCSS